MSAQTDPESLKVSLNRDPLGGGSAVTEPMPFTFAPYTKKMGDETAVATNFGDWIRYPVQPDLVAQGLNRVEITRVAESGSDPLWLQDILLWVKHE